MERNVFWAQDLMNYLNETDEKSFHTGDARNLLNIPEDVPTERMNSIIRAHPRFASGPVREMLKGDRGWRFFLRSKGDEL